MSAVIVWFRQDLRLEDNPALLAAIDRDKPVIPVYISDPDHEGEWAPGGASRWWLHQSLSVLQEEFQQRGIELTFRTGDSLSNLRKLVKQYSADAVYWNQRYEPEAIRQDKSIKQSLRADGLEVTSFNSSLLFEPWQVKTRQGAPYQVYTPFWKQCRALDEPRAPGRKPRKITPPTTFSKTGRLEDLDLMPDIPWYDGIAESWQPGTSGAHRALTAFLEHAIANYDEDRNIPAVRGTSRLSPHLHFGEISPHTVWHAVMEQMNSDDRKGLYANAEVFLKEVVWREFGYHLLYHFPQTANKPLREKFTDFPWNRDKQALKAWQRGQTGYPIVDAGMRELWTTGWMHNRVRMICASFLVKHLRIHWLEGARWFWDTLVDADLANNTLGWQWTAGCGADAAPYFRIFNPMTQGQKFDGQGRYVRHWVPEIAALPDKLLQEPWKADEDTLHKADIVLGETYPHPIVDHVEARDAALAAFSEIKDG